MTVRDAAGCTSAATQATLTAADSACSTDTDTDSTNLRCPTGTIVITAPLGAGFEYSIDGITYQASPTFNLVAQELIM